MMLLAGHPQFAFYALLGFALYALCHAPAGSESTGSGLLPRAGRRLWALLACAGVPLALASLIAAAQVLPMLELSRLSHRAGGSLLSPDASGYRNQALPLWSAVVLALPDFFGNPARGDFWGPANRAEFVGYVGVLPLLLAALAAVSLLVPSLRRPWLAALPAGGARHVAVFLGLALVAMAGSCRTPLGDLLYQIVPGLGRFDRRDACSTFFTVALARWRASAHALHGCRCVSRWRWQWRLLAWRMSAVHCLLDGGALGAEMPSDRRHLPLLRAAGAGWRETGRETPPATAGASPGAGRPLANAWAEPTAPAAPYPPNPVVTALRTRRRARHHARWT